MRGIKNPIDIILVEVLSPIPLTPHILENVTGFKFDEIEEVYHNTDEETFNEIIVEIYDKNYNYRNTYFIDIYHDIKKQEIRLVVYQIL